MKRYPRDTYRAPTPIFTASKIWCMTCAQMRPKDHVRLDRLTDRITGAAKWVYVCADLGEGLPDE